MSKSFLVIFGAIVLLGIPILIPIVILVLVLWYKFEPDSFQSFVSWLTISPSAGTGSTEKPVPENKGFVTYEDQQAKEMARVKFKEGADPWSEENKELTQRLHDLMDRNEKIAKKEMQEEIEQEELLKARKHETPKVSDLYADPATK